MSLYLLLGFSLGINLVPNYQISACLYILNSSKRNFDMCGSYSRFSFMMFENV